MRLVYEKTGEEVKVGDITETSRGERVRVTFFREPHKPGSTGKVSVQCVNEKGEDVRYLAEYYVGVIGAKWIEREDQKVCPVCGAWVSGSGCPDGDCANFYHPNA